MSRLFYSLLLSLALFNIATAQVLPQDSTAAYDLYFTNTGDAPPAGPLSSWPHLGIVITGNRITSMSITSFFSQGPIFLTSSMGNLTALKKLTISGSGSMTGLGNFPATFVNLISLEEIGICCMQFGFDNNNPIFSMPWIKRISANNCLGMSIPPAIGRITSLEYLNVRGNIFGASISPDVCNCTNLEYLDMSNNLYPVGIFPGIGRLTKLKYYNASGGDYEIIGTIPDSIGFCTELRVLNVSGVTRFQGEIPASITNCRKLSTFWAYGEWYGVNPFFQNISAFPDLDTLIVNTSLNQTPTQIPDAFGSLSRLTYLNLSGNGITGNIPAGIGNSPALKILSLSSPYFTGSIPASIGNISTLRNLSITGANITGGIPASLGNLAQLQSLSLSGANIGGTIPASIGNLTSLQSLSLSGCGLTFPIPSSLVNLNSNASVNLSSNKFTFEGLEPLKQHFGVRLNASPQPNISIRYNNVRLSVNAGGTLANNTYKWYRDNSLFRIVTGDSTLLTSATGNYYVEVTNSIVSGLTLTSNVHNVPVRFCPPAGNGTLTCRYAGPYQWQMNDGNGFVNINDNANFSGTTSQILQLINIPSTWTGYQFRCSYDLFRIQFISSWTGALSNDWENPGNWGGCGSVPDDNTDVVITNGSVVLNTNTTIRSLTIVAGATLTISPGVVLTVLH